MTPFHTNLRINLPDGAIVDADLAYSIDLEADEVELKEAVVTKAITLSAPPVGTDITDLINNHAQTRWDLGSEVIELFESKQNERNTEEGAD